MTTPSMPVPRRALITGGGSGLGLAIAEALLAQGAQVAIGDIAPEQLHGVAERLDHAKLLPIELDVTCHDSVKAAIKKCQTTFGGLDTLVNSAGVIHITPLAQISEQQWDQVIDVDLKGTFLCSQAAAPLLCESGRGRIINIGSDASKVGFPMIPHYCAAKFGVVGLTKSLAGELAPNQVTVNCICPVGIPTTGMGQSALDWKMRATGLTAEEVMAASAADIPLKRNAAPEDIVNVALFLLSDSSSFLTGLALDVDGGMLSTIPIPGAAEAGS